MDEEERPLAAASWLRASETRALLEALSAGGRESRFVGGCVRDTLLDPTLDEIDLDLTTQEPPDRVMMLLADAGIHVVPTGLRHGTVTARLERRRFEITTLRRDVASYGRHADVAFTDDFVEDASRRDFTFNAMSCDAQGRLFDPFAGRKDLHAGRVRFVGDPRQRIREDFLRILRFFRFYARFSHDEADPGALAACAAERQGIDGLSGERVRSELFKLLEARAACRSLVLMRETGVMAHILPVPPDTPRLERLVLVAPQADPLLRLAALLRDHADDVLVSAVVERLRLSRHESERLRFLLAAELPAVDDPDITHRRLHYRHGHKLWRDLMRLSAAESGTPADALNAGLTRFADFEPPEFPLAGADLLARGLSPGPEIGRLLQEVRDWWQDQDFAPDRDVCLARLDSLLSGRQRH